MIRRSVLVFVVYKIFKVVPTGIYEWLLSIHGVHFTTYFSSWNYSNGCSAFSCYFFLCYFLDEHRTCVIIGNKESYLKLATTRSTF